MKYYKKFKGFLMLKSFDGLLSLASMYSNLSSSFGNWRAGKPTPDVEKSVIITDDTVRKDDYDSSEEPKEVEVPEGLWDVPRESAKSCFS